MKKFLAVIALTLFVGCNVVTDSTQLRVSTTTLATEYQYKKHIYADNRDALSIEQQKQLDNIFSKLDNLVGELIMTNYQLVDIQDKLALLPEMEATYWEMRNLIESAYWDKLTPEEQASLLSLDKRAKEVYAQAKDMQNKREQNIQFTQYEELMTLLLRIGIGSGMFTVR